MMLRGVHLLQLLLVQGLQVGNYGGWFGFFAVKVIEEWWPVLGLVRIGVVFWRVRKMYKRS